MQKWYHSTCKFQWYCIHVNQKNRKRGCDHLPGYASVAISNPSSPSIIYGHAYEPHLFKLISYGYQEPMNRLRRSWAPVHT